jgi:hypothetical protein
LRHAPEEGVSQTSRFSGTMRVTAKIGVAVVSDVIEFT